MISSEVQRTLVKSPPELWAELSDPAALTRHLGQLGEIRITRAEPEKLVEWEAEGTKGIVRIKPSGWGTRVTLGVTREVSLPEPAPELSPAHEPAPLASEWPPTQLGGFELPLPEEPFAVEEAFAVAYEEPDGAEEAVEYEEDLTEALTFEEQPGDELDALPAEDAPYPRRGFFARLFSWRRKSAPEPCEEVDWGDEEPALDAASEPLDEAPSISEEPDASAPPPAAPTAIESLQARFQPEHLEVPGISAPVEGNVAPELPRGEAEEEPSRPPVDLAAELKAAEEVAVEEVTAVLSAVLDRLGAAHHRPFSRA